MIQLLIDIGGILFITALFIWGIMYIENKRIDNSFKNK